MNKQSRPIVRKERCPRPGCDKKGGDNVAVYDDGSKYCHACNSIIVGSNCKTPVSVVKPNDIALIENGQIHEIQSRGLTYETCKWANYQIAKTKGLTLHVANYYNEHETEIIAQKLRYPADPVTGKKNMSITGAADKRNSLPLYLSWKWHSNDKLFITVVEGEIDALTVAQVQGYQYPIVSVPKGAGDAARSIREYSKYLNGFKYVILAFDSDEAGKRATQECINELEPGKVRIATWNLKDANELLLAGRSKEIKEAIFSAKEVKPDSIVTVQDIVDKVLVKPEFGEPYPWQTMTDITYGYRPGEIMVVVAATGIGKTEFVKDIMFHMLEKKKKIGLFSFEQTPDNTMRRLIGAKLHVKLHLPGSEWNEKHIRDAAMGFNEQIYLYNKAGKVDIQDLFLSIRYLTKARCCQFFIIDNLASLDLSKDMERASNFMNTLKAMVQELNITVLLVSHVSKDKYSYSTYVTTSPKNPDTYNKADAETNSKLINKPGLEWETGRMPTISNVEGSGIVTKLSDFVFALARDTLNQNENIKRMVRVCALKARLDSAYTGKTFKLYYNDEGKLEEIDSITVNGVY